MYSVGCENYYSHMHTHVQVLERSIQMQDSDAMMKAFIDLADHCPKFLRSQIENVVELMLKVGKG